MAKRAALFTLARVGYLVHTEFNFSDWIAFYSAIAALSATLFSVMFLALQVRWRLWKGSRLRRVVATSALAELMIPLFSSIILLMPAHPWRIAVWVTGLFGIAVVLSHWSVFITHRAEAAEYDRIQAITGWLSFCIYFFLFVSGFLPSRLGVYILASLSVWLLFSGASESWLLLTHEDNSTINNRKFVKQLLQSARDRLHLFQANASLWRMWVYLKTSQKTGHWSHRQVNTSYVSTPFDCHAVPGNQEPQCWRSGRNGRLAHPPQRPL